MATTATNHWKLGLFVLLGIGAAVGTLFWLSAERFHRDAFPAITYFDESVQGLDVGSPLKFRGVTLGTVSKITIAPDHRLVEVTADIYVDAVRSLGISDGAPVPKPGQPFMPENLRVQLVAAGITGVRFLELDFFDPVRYPPPPLPFDPPWNYLPSAPSTLRSLEQAALEFANRLPTLGDQASAVMVEGRDTLGSVRQLAEELEGSDGQLARLVGRLDSAAATIEAAVHESDPGHTAAALREASTSVSSAANGVNTGVSDVGEDLHANLVAMRETLESIRALIDTVNRDPSLLVRGRRADSAGVPTK